MKYTGTLPTTPAHTLTVNELGYNEPMTFLTRCSCGWAGIKLEEEGWYINSAKNNYAHEPEPFRTILRAYGPEALLPDGKMYGTRNDAYKQALAHVGYDPAADQKQCLAALHQATVNLQTTITVPGANLTTTQASGAYVENALRDIDRAVWRSIIWDKGTIPTLPQRHPEVAQLLTEHTTD